MSNIEDMNAIEETYDNEDASDIEEINYIDIMNNTTVRDYLKLCEEELEKISRLIGENVFNTANNYLTKYSIIKACGTIEQAFKDIIVDFLKENNNLSQVNNYIENKIKKSSMNPSFENMNKLLKDFDISWSKQFKYDIEERNNSIEGGNLKESLLSLNNARNSFAHGINTSITIGDVLKYFDHAAQIIQIYDNIVYSSIQNE